MLGAADELLAQGELGDSIKRRRVGKASLEAVVNRLLLVVRVPARRIHRYRELRPPPNASLVLLLEAEVASEGLEEPLADLQVKLSCGSRSK